MTWQQLIRLAMIEIGILVAGEDPETDDVAVGLSRLKEMIESWAIEGLLVNDFLKFTHSVPDPATDAYTIGGDSPDIPAVTSPIAPTRIEAVIYYRASPALTLNLTRVAQKYALASIGPGIDADTPTRFSYDNGDPQGELIFDKAGTAGDSFTVIGRGRIIAPSAVTLEADISLPQGYRRALLLNLAVDLAGSFAVDPARLNVTAQLALAAKEELKQQNAEPLSEHEKRMLMREKIREAARDMDRQAGRSAER